MRRAAPILCLAVGCAGLFQLGLGWNDMSHYAQVRAFDDGTAVIDEYVHTTGDFGVHEGHYYSDKAPGLAFATFPAYKLARALGMDSSDTNEVHLLVVFGALLPLVLLMLLVSQFVNRFESGMGPIVAIVLWLGSMLLPFSTIFFSHVLAACLGFAAYYLLSLKQRRDDPRFLLAAGLLGGLAVTVEYQAAILVALLGIYSLARGDWLRRLGLYAAGVVVGLLPLLAYNAWAFGTPLHNSYSNVEQNEIGLLGLERPSPGAALDLLFGARGLFILTPLMAVAMVGIVLLHREGRIREARMAAAVALAYLVFNASYWLPFGGFSPGPRFLITVIPFLALPLAVALRRLPAATLSLAAVSVATMVAGTLTRAELPQRESSGYWWARLRDGDFGVAEGGLAAAWFAGWAALGVVIAVRRMPRLSVNRAQVELAAAATLGWIVLAAAGGTLKGGPDFDLGDGGLVLLVVALAGALWLWPKEKALAALATVPLLVCALPGIHSDYALVALLASLSLALLVVGYAASFRGVRL